MRGTRIFIAALAVLAVGGCMRHSAQTTYIIDPQTGQPIPVVAQQPQQFVQPQYAQAPSPNNQQALYSSSPAYAQQSYAQQQYAEPVYRQPAPARSGGRGLFTSRRAAPVYPQQPTPQQPYIAQYTPPPAAAPHYAAPVAAPRAAASNAYAYAPTTTAYTLDSGDKLRVVVFGQDGITNSYMVDASGNISLPLIGTVPARGYSTQELSRTITNKLKQGYVREPHVTVEVEAYRPFFILGEVTTPGQYPYVANMTAETAIAIAGGFAPRASKGKVEITRNAPGQQFHGEVPVTFPLRPGDTVVVKERWF